MRKLATIRTISEIRPIAKADNLELAIIDGWKAVVKKDEHNPGDKIIYCEIDSFLPIEPQYEFLRKSCYRKLADGSEGFRIKTMKLRGELSQGLVLPYDGELEVGTDVTDVLGITKYDPTVGRVGIGDEIKAPFPGFIPKTDEERIQNLSEQLPELLQRSWTVTEKLDGTSFTCYWKDGEFGVCSRNWVVARVTDTEFDVSNSAHWYVTKQHGLDRVESVKNNIAIQGEIVGTNIQGNKYKLEDKQLYVFNVWDIDKQEYFNPLDAEDFALELGLKFVPRLNYGLIFNEDTDVEAILKRAEGKSQLNNQVEREGLVFVSDEGERISFKAISNKFLLKED